MRFGQEGKQHINGQVAGFVLCKEIIFCFSAILVNLNSHSSGSKINVHFFIVL